MLVHILSAVLSLGLVALLAAVQIMHRRGKAYQAFCWFRVGMFLWLALVCIWYMVFNDVIAGAIAACAFAVTGIIFIPKALKSHLSNG